MNKSYSEIGDLLKAARKDMRLSISEAATRLHIRTRYLELLEAGEFKDLPGVSYAKGYLARYATFLRLDKDEILRRFEQVEVALERRGFYLPLTFSSEKKPSHAIVLGALAAAFLLVILGSQLTAPKRQALPIVESPDKIRLLVTESQMAFPIPDVPCFIQAESLYPPCSWQNIEYGKAREVIDNEYQAALIMALVQKITKQPFDEQISAAALAISKQKKITDTSELPAPKQETEPLKLAIP